MPLRVDTAVPYGNACDVRIVTEGPVPEVHFAADPHGGPECLWFCFRLVADEGRAGGDRVRLVLQHASNMLGGRPAEAMRPVARYDGRDWQRLAPGTAEPLPDGRWFTVWTVPAPATWMDVAYCYPYGRPEVEALVAETAGVWRAETIGVSQGGRPIVRLSNGPGQEGGERPGLYFVGRQHSGETPGTWVLDGLLRSLATKGEAAPLVWAVPLSNIDGVEGGDYGKDNFPFDLNRAWDHPPTGQPMRHEVLVIQRDANRWRVRCRPALGLDFHAPGGCETDGAYFYLPDRHAESQAYARAHRWAALLAAAAGPTYMAGESARVADYPSRWTTPSFRYFFQALGIPGLCLETPYATAGETLLTREAYRDFGRRLAEGLVRALRV